MNKNIHLLRIELQSLQNSEKLTKAPEISYISEDKELTLEDTIKLLGEFSSDDFGGKWSVSTFSISHLFNTAFGNIEGKAKLWFHLNSYIGITNATYFNLKVKLYDGYFLNDNTEISTQFRLVSGLSDGLKLLNQECAIETGHLFTKPSNKPVYWNIMLKFWRNEHTDEKKIKFVFESVKNSEMMLEIDFSSPYSFEVSSWRIFFYSTVLFGIWIIFCNELIVLTRQANDSQAVAKRVSVLSIGWNTIWNMWLFNIHCSYTLSDSRYYMLILPSMMYFIIWIVFQITLLHICWKARNQELGVLNPEEMRKQIIIFYVKFYISYIIAISLSDYIFSNSVLLIASNGLFWVPQIIENVQNRSKNVPYTFFTVAWTFWQAFMPCYFLFFKTNIFEIKYSPTSGWLLVGLHLSSILILYLQKKLGSQFFIPRSLRWKCEYTFLTIVEDLEGESDKDWAIWLNHLREPQGELNEPRDDAAAVYVRTPCNHKFHPHWLRTWLNQKLEWPSCRTQVPSLESDDEEY